MFGGVSGFSVSDGKRVGTVTKFSKKGILWKTYEGDLLLGGQGTVTSSHWNFTVSDSTVALKVEKSMDEQDLIEAEYHQCLFVFPWNGDTNYFVTNVKLVHKPASTSAPPSQLEAR